jgi:alpha-tubulin suppressor-like RCC1 family protein
MGIKTNSTLWTWGYNLYGQLGDGTITTRKTPKQIGTDSEWSIIVGGRQHTISFKTNTNVWIWGRNNYGQLGLGDTTNRKTPTQIQTGIETDWLIIAGGEYHTVGIVTNGTLWTWGNNEYGQLGLGDTISRVTPSLIQIGSDSDWFMVAAGDSYNISLKIDKTLWTWGNNESGQLGLDDTINRWTPVQVGSDTDWFMITGGGDHTISLKTNGMLWTWGNNVYGQLGLGDSINRWTPSQIQTDINADWSMIAAGDNHTIGIKANGTIWTWGRNDDGQLGLGDNMDRWTPVQVGTRVDWSIIAAGRNHNISLKTNCTLWTWGNNEDGQLGLGNLTNKRTPTLVEEQ